MTEKGTAAKKTALVVCPGRGTYTGQELGYLAAHHADKTALIDALDADRARRGLTAVRDLDARRTYRTADHSRGDNATALIFACAYADFLSIDRDAYDVVAVTGNYLGGISVAACLDGAVDTGDRVVAFLEDRKTREPVISLPSTLPVPSRNMAGYPG